MRSFVLSLFIFIFYRLLMATWRVKLSEPAPMLESLRKREPFILAHWHGDELALIQLTGRYRIGTIVSQSKDGEMMNNVLRWLGAKTVRGSSTRGGIGAFKGLMKLVKAGATCSFAVDGPKGPLYQVKPGVFETSRALELPIYWCGVACDRAWRFEKSWNKTYLPKPFAKIEIQWHGPFQSIGKDENPRDLGLATKLATALNAAKQQALVSIAQDEVGD